MAQLPLMNTNPQPESSPVLRIPPGTAFRRPLEASVAGHRIGNGGNSGLSIELPDGDEHAVA